MQIFLINEIYHEDEIFINKIYFLINEIDN